ncbi:MAG TPA: M13 family metallopeptidase [Candidatus Obscuribacter sp.]|nr:M13 family metallopeptidase [Candidatus Obscuribacter sp.]
MSNPHGIKHNFLDQNAKPGEDFFRFANGAFIDSAQLPPGHARWCMFDEVNEQAQTAIKAIMTEAAELGEQGSIEQRQIGDFYLSGMNLEQIEAEGLTALAPLLSMINKSGTPRTFARALGHMHMVGMAPFFGFGSMQSFADSKQQIAATGQAGLSLPDRSYYLKKTKKNLELMRQFEQHVVNMFVLMGESKPRAMRFAAAVCRLETTLARASMPQEDMRNPNNINHVMTVDELKAMVPHFDFDTYFQTIGAPAFSSLNVMQPKFFKAISRVLSKLTKLERIAYLKWHLISTAAPKLGSAFVDEDFAFFGKVLQGKTSQLPRWKKVVSTVDSLLGEAVGKTYVAKHFPPYAKARCLEMIANLSLVLRQSIENLSWMSEQTKANALKKMDTVRFKIGYPETWLDYTEAAIDRSSYLKNAFSLKRLAFKRDLAKIGKPVDPNEWHMTPQTVNAYADPQNNELVFPAAILQPPFFDPQADDAANYGAILVIIGHEFTHLFDDAGAQYDEQGNVRLWWAETDFADFMQRIELLRQQFGGYKVGTISLKGDLVSGEAAADLGGLSLAYRALQIAMLKNEPYTDELGFTDEQRFFIAFGQIWALICTPEFAEMQAVSDPHPPAQFRVNGTLANFAPFVKAFATMGVTDESPIMLPVDKRCQLW